jgi:iron complex transport system substrate-binding protein
LLAACLVTSVFAIAACGGDDDSTSTTAAATDTTTTAETTTASASTAPAAAFPVTVEHALGTTVIDAEPQRVVTVGYTEQDTLLALGVIPVGVTDWYGDQPYGVWPWAQEALGDAQPTLLSASDGFEYERIAALEPDLIIGTNAGIDAESYGKLTAIAPTIAHPKDAALYFSPWKDQDRLIGRALGREAEVEALIADIEEQFATAAAANPEFAGASAIFLQNAFYEGSAIAYQDGLSTAFLTDLGFVVPPELDAFESEGGQAYIPLEQLPVLDVADVLIWGTEGPDDRAGLEAEPLYMQLEEVRDGRLVFTDGLTAGAIYFTSILSLPYVLEHLVPALASTLAGNGPATIDAT